MQEQHADHGRAVERADPVEDAPLGLLSHAPHAAEPAGLDGGLELGDGAHAERRLERGDPVEPEPGNAAQLERARRHALTERVEHRRSAP